MKVNNYARPRSPRVDPLLGLGHKPLRWSLPAGGEPNLLLKPNCVSQPLAVGFHQGGERSSVLHFYLGCFLVELGGIVELVNRVFRGIGFCFVHNLLRYAIAQARGQACFEVLQVACFDQL